MTSKLIPLTLGFLLGNKQARDQIAISLQQIIGQGIDALNKMDGTENVSNISKPEEK